MPDYANGKIYKIVCNITGDQYIGATTQKLSQRLTCHVSKKNTDKKCKSKDIILRGDYQIVLIENYSCNNKEELERKEREYIESNTCVNKFIPTRTPKEYREDHKEKYALYSKNNRDEINRKRRERYVKNTEARSLYRDENKDEINRKRRESYHKKKQEKMEKVNELI
jgi:hypothetical protein